VAVRYCSKLPAGAELVVVGGGVAGAATAFHAARAGLDVLLLERRPALCTLTTAVATGGFRLQLDDPEELRLVRESVALFGELAATGERDYDPSVRRRGYLYLTTSHDGAARQRELVAAQRSWGLDDVELLPGEQARRAFPFVAPEVVQARFRAADGLLDPKALTFGLVAASGARVAVGCGVTGVRATGGRVELATSSGAVAADVAVVAAGPFSAQVAALAGVELPLANVRRHKLVLPEAPEVPAHAPMTVDDDTGAHWRPLLGGAALLFPDDEPPAAAVEDVPVDHRFAFRLLDPASPAAVARTAPFWRQVWRRGAAHWFLQAGQYTLTPDRRPLIGPTPVPGLYVNCGYGGHGVMVAPAGSRHLIDLITGTLPAAANPFRLDRPLVPRPRLERL
jgi:sarcosine oxidase, subunit beta